MTGCVFIHGDTLKEIGIRNNETILIRSDTETVAIAQKARKKVLKDEIILDHEIRWKGRIEIGQEVSVRKISIPVVRSVTFAPVDRLIKSSFRLRAVANRTLSQKLISVGDSWPFYARDGLFSLERLEQFRVVDMEPKVKVARFTSNAKIIFQETLAPLKEPEIDERELIRKENDPLGHPKAGWKFSIARVRLHLWLNEHRMKIELREKTKQIDQKKISKAKQVIVAPLQGVMSKQVTDEMNSGGNMKGYRSGFVGCTLFEGQTVWIPMGGILFTPFRVLSTKPKSPVHITSWKSVKIIIVDDLPEVTLHEQWWLKPRARDIASIWQLVDYATGLLMESPQSNEQRELVVKEYKEALLEVSPQQDAESASNLRMELGSLYMHLVIDNIDSEYVELSKQMFEEALSFLSKESMPEDWATCCMLLGKLHLYLEEPEKAIPFIADALGFVTYDFHSGHHAKLLVLLGSAYIQLCSNSRFDLVKQENATKALDLVSEAYRILKSLDREYQHPTYHMKIRWYQIDVGTAKWEMGNAYLSLSEVKEKQENVKKALRYYKSAMKIFNLKSHRWQYASLLSNIGIALLAIAEGKNRKSNAEKSIEAFRKAIEIHRLIDSNCDVESLEERIRQAEKVSAGTDVVSDHS